MAIILKNIQTEKKKKRELKIYCVVFNIGIYEVDMNSMFHKALVYS